MNVLRYGMLASILTGVTIGQFYCRIGLCELTLTGGWNMPAKKKNPQDATLRNVRATAKRFTALAQVVSSLDRDMTKVLKRLDALEGRGKRR